MKGSRSRRQGKKSVPPSCQDEDVRGHFQVEPEEVTQEITSTNQMDTAATIDPVKLKKYPPIVLEKIPNWRKHALALEEKLGRIATAKAYGTGVVFLPADEVEYRTIHAYFSNLEKEEGVVWFSYSPANERSLKLAIRGLPADSKTSEIAEDLHRLGYQMENVRKVEGRKGRPCIVFVQLKKTPLTREIFKITTLISREGIVFEPWKGRKGPAQCHRCQGFRHSSHNCFRELACVRCGGPHFAQQCPRPLEDPPTCVNCEGAHTANNPKCPKFVKEARNKKAGSLVANSVPRKRDSPRFNFAPWGSTSDLLIADNENND